MSARWVRGGGGFFLAVAVAAALAGLTPFDWVKPLGSLVRRAEDMTSERFSRLQHVCWTVAFSLTVLGIACRRRSEVIAEFLAAVYRNRPRHIPLLPDKVSQHGLGNLPAMRDNTVTVMACGIVIAGTLLRLWHLDDPVAYDEAYTYLNFASRPWYEAIGDYNSTNNHLLNTLLVHLSTRLFGPEEWALRLPVFCFGCLLPWVVFVWIRRWLGESVGLVTAAFAVVSPMLVTYSVDARGYMYVALAAIVLDTAMGSLNQSPRPRTWCVAWLAMVVGLCAMPIMVYAVVASLGWYIAASFWQTPAMKWSQFLLRMRLSVQLVAATALPVGAFYTPAYIFRGLMFLRDPIMQSDRGANYVLSLANGWRDALELATQGSIPWWTWLFFCGLGVWKMSHCRGFWLRWTAPFVTVLTLNLVQHVAPPPRIFLHLSPWLFVLAAAGIAGAWRNRRCEVYLQSRVVGITASLLIVLAGCLYAGRHPVLFEITDRSSYRAVPRVIDKLHQQMRDDKGFQPVLFAPLPCDLPALFYMDRLHFRVPLNETPKPGQPVWLMARSGESPADVLGNMVVKMRSVEDQFSPWRIIEELETMTVYESIFDKDADSADENPR